MHRINLSQAEEKALYNTYKKTDDKRLRDRCQSILMASRQRPRKQIAQDIGIDKKTLLLWILSYYRGGLEGLKIKWAPGKKPLISEELASEIIEWVKIRPAKCGLDRANWTYKELAIYLYQQKGIKIGCTAMRNFCIKHDIRPYRPTYEYKKGDKDAQELAKKEIEELKKKAEDQEIVLLSQDEAKFPMVPTLQKTLGVKGFRPIVGNDDNKDNVYLFGSMNLVTGALTTNLCDHSKKTKNKKGYFQKKFVEHLEHVAKIYPAELYPKVVLTIDGASWHKGNAVKQVLEKHSHLELYRLPSYSPKLQLIERFWKVLRRRATHNRFFPLIQQMKQSLRKNISYYQTMKKRILSIIKSPRKKTK